MTKKTNTLWQFFASVKLALTSLILLAVTSIIGTIVKQNQAPSYYVQEYGPNLSRLFEVLDITDMYSSWWFVFLLCLFAANLAVCSIERLPGTWKAMTRDNLTVDPRQLSKMRFTHREETRLSLESATARMHQSMLRAGWKNPQKREGEGSILLFAQAGAWTRLGVYIVHLSILVILIGVLLGTLFGYQAYVFLPEGRSTGNIYLRKSQEPVPLGFELRNDGFEKAFYPNGDVREYRADLTVHDSSREDSYRKSIIVNDPLSYRGLTFYIGDAQPLEEYLVLIQDQATGAQTAYRVPPERDVPLGEGGGSFRLEELRRDLDGAVQQAKIRFAGDEAATASVFWVDNKGSAVTGRPGEEVTLSFRQLYSTLLLVKKDPGVSILFFGCGLMVLGLAVSFFLSHRQIWIQITPGKRGSQILVAGSANKNRLAFEGAFRKLVGSLAQDEPEAPAGSACPLISARGQ